MIERKVRFEREDSFKEDARSSAQEKLLENEQKLKKECTKKEARKKK